MRAGSVRDNDADVGADPEDVVLVQATGYLPGPDCAATELIWVPALGQQQVSRS